MLFSDHIHCYMPASALPEPLCTQVQPSQEPVIPGGLLRLGPNCPDDVAASTNWTVARFAWGER